MIAPIPLAMILCDNIIIDKMTEKKTLVGLFSNIGAASFPFRAHHFAIYIALTDGHGEYTGRLSCTDADSREIFGAVGKIMFPGGAKTVVEMVFDIGGLMFPAEGTYVFSFFCNDEMVISRECDVVRREVPPRQAEEGK